MSPLEICSLRFDIRSQLLNCISRFLPRFYLNLLLYMRIHTLGTAYIRHQFDETEDQ